MANVVLIGTLDTKRDEYGWLRDKLHAAGASTTLVDVGTFSDGAGIADVTSAEVAAIAGRDLDRLRADDDRGAAMTAMSEGAAIVVTRLFERGDLHAVLAVGGSSGSAVAGAAMQALPVGVPKLLVTTMAAGDVRPYVGARDVTLMPSVVDVAGINQISRSTLGNAVAAAAGMAEAHLARRQAGAHQADAPLIGASMFGLTTPAVDEARERLTDLGYEVLVFHATGAGGRAMESLAADGFLAGVLDLTTTEPGNRREVTLDAGHLERLLTLLGGGHGHVHDEHRDRVLLGRKRAHPDPLAPAGETSPVRRVQRAGTLTQRGLLGLGSGLA